MFNYNMNNVESYQKDMIQLAEFLDSENFLEETIFNEVFRKDSCFYDEEKARNHFKDKPYSKMMIEDPRYLDFLNYRRIKSFYKELSLKPA